jgi:hypothetical protein
MLKPTPFLKLKRNQFFQMKKYKLKIREMNKNYLRVYLGILSLYYIIAIVLHFVLKEGIIFTQEVNLGNGMVYTPDREHGKYLVSIILILVFIDIEYRGSSDQHHDDIHAYVLLY